MSGSSLSHSKLSALDISNRGSGPVERADVTANTQSVGDCSRARAFPRRKVAAWPHGIFPSRIV